MRFLKILILAVLIPQLAVAGLPPTTSKGQSDANKSTTFDYQWPFNQVTKTSGTAALIDTGHQNLLKNPGFEATTYSTSWTASGGVSAVGATTNILFGSKSYTWDSSASSQTLTSDAITVPYGLYAQNCEVAARIQVPSGTATHTLGVYNGSSLLYSNTITSSTTPTLNTVYFPCPSSGTIALRVTSVASNEPLIAIDDTYMGPARKLGSVNNFTDWQSYTPTIGLTGGSTTTTAYYRRVGDSAEVILEATFSTVFTGGSATVTLPSSCTIDTAKLGSSTQGVQILGQAGLYDVGSGVHLGRVVYWTTSTVYVRAEQDDVGTGGNHLYEAAVTTTVPFTWVNGDKLNAKFSVPCVGWQSEQAFRPETTAWRVDANISGANPDMGSAAQSSYIGIENGSLTLTNNTGAGVITAQIPCSSTNSPSGTTCSAGSESVGVSFNVPSAQDVLACVSTGHVIAVGSPGNVNATFQIVETPNNAQTISQEGKSRVTSNNGTSGGATIVPFRVCGTFSFSSGGQKTLRLMYEQTTSGTVTSNIIVGDAAAGNGNRDIHWEVYPLNQQVPAPLLVGSVTSNSTGLERSERALYYCAASSSISSQSGSWLSAVTNYATGACTLTIPSGLFSAAPVCTGSTDVAGNWVSVTSASATSLIIRCINDASANCSSGYGVFLQCQGPR